MSESDANAKHERRRMSGFIVGSLMIAYGLIGALVSYYSDSNSMDLITALDATENAIIHAVIWSVCGGGLILWYLGPGRLPRSEFDDEGPGPSPPHQFDEDGRDRSR